MYLSMVPPCSVTTAPSSRKAASTMRATISGSVRSAREVNPTTSANNTVASLRSWRGVASLDATGASINTAPHCPQKRWLSAWDAPQLGQPMSSRRVPHSPQKRNPSGLVVPHTRHAGTTLKLPGPPRLGCVITALLLWRGSIAE